MNVTIQECTVEHVEQYGRIYAEAFRGEPWNDNWKEEDAVIHISEIMESSHAYGLECLCDGEVAGFILGASMLFHYGRTFEINDLAVSPVYQRKGIAGRLMDRMMADLKNKGIVGIHLITSKDGILPGFYEKYGFKKENEVILMGKTM
ncbi:MAG: GNAT family N-acetyltransferase [Lachnospiraceae bacterium]|nr:GNAT family N-acetyltransferase [Lachnospiraceae bacterium]